MKKGKILLTVLTSLLFPWLLNAQIHTFAAVHSPNPEYQVEKKIKRGIREGRLTKREVKHLKREFRDIRNLQDRAWRDGDLSRRERKRIDHEMREFDRMLHHYLNNSERQRPHRKDRNWDGEDWGWDDNDRDNYDYYYGKKGRH